MALNHPWCTSQWFIHSVLCTVADYYSILDSSATQRWMLIIGRHTKASPASYSIMYSHPQHIVVQFISSMIDSQWTRFDDPVIVSLIQSPYTAISRSESGYLKFLEMYTVSFMLANLISWPTSCQFMHCPLFEVFHSCQCVWFHFLQIADCNHGLP